MKCRYCGRDLSGTDEYRRREHRRLCKNATADVRRIHSGIPQKDPPEANMSNESEVSCEDV